MMEQTTIQQKTSVQIVYEQCCRTQANVQSSRIRNGDADGAYIAFHQLFGTFYNHVLVSGGTVSEIRVGDRLLLDMVVDWLESPPRSVNTRQGRAHYVVGVHLFRQLASALAKAGVLR